MHLGTILWISLLSGIMILLIFLVFLRYFLFETGRLKKKPLKDDEIASTFFTEIQTKSDNKFKNLQKHYGNKKQDE